MRSREISGRQRALNKMVEPMRSKLGIEEINVLVNKDAAAWSKLDLTPKQRAELGAWVSTVAFTNQQRVRFTQLRQRGVDEHKVNVLFGNPAVEVKKFSQQLIGAIHERVPYAEQDIDRYETLLLMWPQTKFEKQNWNQMLKLASILAEVATPKIEYPGTVDILPDSEMSSQDCLWDETMKENYRLAQHIVHATANGEFELPGFSEPRMKEFAETFGKPGVRLLARSNRLSVALSVCTDFWRFEAGESRLLAFRLYLASVERLVGIWHRQCGLDCNEGGPLSASLQDLGRLRIPEAVIREYWSVCKTAYTSSLSDALGVAVDLERFRPNSDMEIEAADRCWRDAYKGVPAISEFINSYLFSVEFRTFPEQGLSESAS
ncbi:hypothetical protein [Ferrimicrobium sp.]|uniref:hypothetical protein n=1 Tax=Ferrimicrobium sp. TaxID=2926050 RepID=UPI0026132F69|nr:hypothetical protein [Ferrimicrobium sp.]